MLEPLGMSQAAGGPPGEEAAFFSGEAVEEGVTLEMGEVLGISKCSSCWWKTSLRRLKRWKGGAGEGVLRGEGEEAVGAGQGTSKDRSIE